MKNTVKLILFWINMSFYFRGVSLERLFDKAGSNKLFLTWILKIHPNRKNIVYNRTKRISGILTKEYIL